MFGNLATLLSECFFKAALTCHGKSQSLAPRQPAPGSGGSARLRLLPLG
jgi:hypothetical protein